VMQVEQPTAARDGGWNSMVSLLRSKFASKQAAGELEDTNFDESLRNEVFIGFKGGFLSVWLNPETGKGSWYAVTEKLDVAQPWFMSIDGKVELSGEAMDISSAVDRLAAKISTK